MYPIGVGRGTGGVQAFSIPFCSVLDGIGGHPAGNLFPFEKSASWYRRYEIYDHLRPGIYLFERIKVFFEKKKKMPLSHSPNSLRLFLPHRGAPIAEYPPVTIAGLAIHSPRTVYPSILNSTFLAAFLWKKKRG